MTTTDPLLPDLARELIVRATQSVARRARRLRNQLDAVHLGQVRHADHADTKVLRRILAEHAWPGSRLIGDDAARAAWQIALHADDEPDFQRVAARLMHRAVQANDASIRQWAHLHDRALINSGEAQEYGTQYRLGRAGLEPCPVREPATLDTRRNGVDLPPAAAALQALHQRLASPPNHAALASDTIDLLPLAGAA